MQRGYSMVFVNKSTFFLYVVFKQKKSRKKHFLIFWVEKNASWISKVKFSHSRKKSTFSKGVYSLWFMSKNRPFSYIFFWAKRAGKKHFLIFWIENKAFRTSKVKFSRSRKKSTFCKRYAFCQKIDLFLWCFFCVCAKKAWKKHFLIFWIVKNAF